MKKKKNKELIIVTGILLGLVLCLLAGNIYLKEAENRQKLEKSQLEKEKETLTEQIRETEEKQTELQKELEKIKKETEQETQAEPEETEKQEEQQDNAEETESQETKAAELNTVAQVIQSEIGDGIYAGESWQVYVQRLSDGAEASVGTGQMVAASLIKLYIMGAVYDSYDTLTSANGQETVDSLLKSMITVSDNDAANSLTKMLGQGDGAAGRDVVNHYCIQNGYGETSMGRMLLETGTDRENYTSARDCGKFLENVYRGNLSHAQEMLSLLKQQERTGKIPAGIPEGVETANKTGELDSVENDAAIVFAGEKPYVLCILSGNLGSTSDARQKITRLSSEIYESVQQ
ncbi:MAG: serine hydrolase [Blautia sp.]|nr:class A beta-lactamase-related serine hydrolase [Blautia sp.]